MCAGVGASLNVSQPVTTSAGAAAAAACTAHSAAKKQQRRSTLFSVCVFVFLMWQPEQDLSGLRPANQSCLELLAPGRPLCSSVLSRTFRYSRQRVRSA
eukprot:3247657-Rhodomonas_salina.1